MCTGMHITVCIEMRIDMCIVMLIIDVCVVMLANDEITLYLNRAYKDFQISPRWGHHSIDMCIDMSRRHAPPMHLGWIWQYPEVQADEVANRVAITI